MKYLVSLTFRYIESNRETYCILDEELRAFSADSISEWKKIFLAECKNCQWSDKCAGVFATSAKIPKGIKCKI